MPAARVKENGAAEIGAGTAAVLPALVMLLVGAVDVFVAAGADALCNGDRIDRFCLVRSFGVSGSFSTGGLSSSNILIVCMQIRYDDGFDGLIFTLVGEDGGMDLQDPLVGCGESLQLRHQTAGLLCVQFSLLEVVNEIKMET